MKAETELRPAEDCRAQPQSQTDIAFLASIVDFCEDAIIGKLLDGTVVTWNFAAERLYGYTAQEMIGRSISVLFPPYRPEELPDILDQIKRGRKVERLETVRLRKDGVAVEVSLTISPIKDAEGRIIGASTVARDITARRREENERLVLINDLVAALTRAEAA